MTTMIEVESLRKVYRGGWRTPPVTALKDVSFAVAAGEAFGFIGPNGAGKSTAIKLLVAAMRPDGGRIALQGLPVDNPESRRGLGYVPENPSLYEYLTPIEILQMGVSLHGVRVDDSRQYCQRWLERLDLANASQRAIRSFSKGMVQRTAIAFALAIQPRLLILDEPLSGLDPIGRRDVVELLAEYKREGGTLFFTSHVLHDVERLADRFGLIHEGHLRSVQTPAELVGDEETVFVRSQGIAVVDGMVSESHNRWSGTVTRAQLWSRLEALKSSGHTVIEVRPTLSLEAAFLRAVGHA